MIERERKLEAAPTFRMPDLAVLGADIVATTLPPERTTSVYHDTPDLRLARAGASLRFRTDDGWTVKLPGSSVDGLITRSELRFAGPQHTMPPEAMDVVRSLCRTAPLAPRVRLRTLRRRTLVDDAQGLRLFELDDDEVSVLGTGNRIAARFRELEIELTDDTPADLLDAAVFELKEAGATEQSPLPKSVRALGPRARQAPDLVEEPLPPRPTVIDLIRYSLTASVADLLHWDPIARLDLDVEGVHRMRVAVRRLRSHLRTFSAHTDPDWNSALRSELAWLGEELGAHRDADVRVADLVERSAALPQPSDAEPLVAAARKQRARNHRDLVEVLRSARYLELLETLVTASRTPAVVLDADQPATTLTSATQGQWESLRGRVSRCASPPTDEELHRIRIHAKRCRYAAEALEPVIGKQARAFAAAAADLQTVLGGHQDAIVLRAWLREHAQGDPDVAFAAGELAGLELERASACRGDWWRAWKRLRGLRKPRRWA